MDLARMLTPRNLLVGGGILIAVKLLTQRTAQAGGGIELKVGFQALGATYGSRAYGLAAWKRVADGATGATGGRIKVAGTIRNTGNQSKTVKAWLKAMGPASSATLFGLGAAATVSALHTLAAGATAVVSLEVAVPNLVGFYDGQVEVTSEDGVTMYASQRSPGKLIEVTPETAFAVDSGTSFTASVFAQSPSVRAEVR